jgi:hypothetical protein
MNGLCVHVRMYVYYVCMYVCMHVFTYGIFLRYEMQINLPVLTSACAET